TTAATDPVGFTSLSLPVNSDSLISIPFTRPAVFSGAIGSVSGNNITVASSPGWMANQYVYAQGVQSNTYYAIIGPLLKTVSGTVTATNGSTAITATAGLSSIVAGDEIIINGLAYNVASVTSDTALVLSRAYTGTNGSGLAASYDHSPKEGSYYTVTGNGANSLTVNLNGDVLTNVAAGTTVTLIPYWTLGTAFPVSDAGTSYIASTGLAPRSYQTQLLLPDLTSAGYNLANSSGYINYNSAWRLQGSDGTASYNDTILPPTAYFTVRNANTATTFTPTGGVYMNRITTVLDTQASTVQDNAVAVPRPVAISLNDLGLVSSGAFSVSTGTAPRSIKDTLLVYDNSVIGLNKANSAGYFYYNGGWRLVGSDGTVDYGTTTIPYGTGVIIRKAIVASGSSSFWQNTRTY
ncbi:MAG: TIGR02597 family protein, partial [Rhodospirillales bacterium]|nr:TIGR02597 family protein [Acetobacter sp.]